MLLRPFFAFPRRLWPCVCVFGGLHCRIHTCAHPSPDWQQRWVCGCRSRRHKLQHAHTRSNIGLIVCLCCGVVFRTFRGHTDHVTSLCFSPTLKQLVSGSADNTVMVWNFRPQLRSYRFEGHTVGLLVQVLAWLFCALLPAHSFFASRHCVLPYTRLTRLSATVCGVAVTSLHTSTSQGAVNAVAYSPDSKLIVSGSSDRTVRLWRPTVRGESSVLKGHGGAVRSVDMSWDGRRLLTGSDDKTAKVWSVPSKRFMCSLAGHHNWIRDARFSPDGWLAATASDDKTVRLWDVEKHTSLQTYFDHSGYVSISLLSGDATRRHPDTTAVVYPCL